MLMGMGPVIVVTKTRRETGASPFCQIRTASRAGAARIGSRRVLPEWIPADE